VLGAICGCPVTHFFILHGASFDRTATVFLWPRQQQNNPIIFIEINLKKTENILDLNHKYEDICKVVEVCVEQLETEKHERIHTASELTALVHELRQEVFAGD